MSATHGKGYRAVSRRRFLAGASALGGSSLLSLAPSASAEPPPETTTLRIFEGPVTCIAPSYVTEQLLRAEGFTDVRYVKAPSQTNDWPPTNLLTAKSTSALHSCRLP